MLNTNQIKTIKNIISSAKDIKDAIANLQNENIEIKYKFYEAEVTTNDKRTFNSIITSENIDRDGEILKSQGLDYSDFLKNPLIFYNHDYDSIPIGKCIKLNKFDTYWTAEGQIATRPEWLQNTDFLPDSIWALMSKPNNILKGVSLGFIPIDSRKPSKKDIEQYGNSIKRVINKYMLLEYSIVNLPCNPKALITYVNDNAKSLSKNDIKKIFNIDETIKEEVKEIKNVNTVCVNSIDYKSLLKREFDKELMRRKGYLYC